MIASFSVPAHSGTGAGSVEVEARRRRRGCPTAAWTIDLAMLHEISGVSAVDRLGLGLEQVGRAHAVALDDQLAVLDDDQRRA